MTGTFNAYAAPRTRVTRLLASASPGDSTIKVATGLDYQAGDQLGLPATNVNVYDSETVTVASYAEVSGEGIITLTSALQGYHFGAATSTAADYGGVDMRGEVLQLTSHVSITNTQESPTTFRNWAVIISDFTDQNDGNIYSGTCNIEHISIQGVSQEGASAILRIDGA